jgi:hypothetical protein
MPQEWVEINLVPISPEQSERSLLLELVDPLVHETFNGRIAAWFYGWYSLPREYHLRVRIRWQELDRSDNDRDDLYRVLNDARDNGRLARWWPGRDGTEGEIYPGEADRYPDLWELSYKDWQSGSELALALAKLDPDNLFARRREEHWHSRVHLHSNRLKLGYYYEAAFSLIRAYEALAEAGRDPQLAHFVTSIQQSIMPLIQQLKQGPPSP